jgi:hypothetical protein
MSLVRVLEKKLLNDGKLPENLTHCLYLTVLTVKLWFGQFSRNDLINARSVKEAAKTLAFYAKSHPTKNPKPYLPLLLLKSPVRNDHIYDRLQRESWDCIILGQAYCALVSSDLEGPLCLVVNWHGETVKRIGCLRCLTTDEEIELVRDSDLEAYIRRTSVLRVVRLG